MKILSGNRTWHWLCQPKKCYDFRVSKKKPHENTATTEFEVEGIEEAYAPARNRAPGKPWTGSDLPKLEVEKPPQLQDPVEHTARIWILERRTRGLIARFRRWLVGKRRG